MCLVFRCVPVTLQAENQLNRVLQQSPSIKRVMDRIIKMAACACLSRAAATIGISTTKADRYLSAWTAKAGIVGCLRRQASDAFSSPSSLLFLIPSKFPVRHTSSFGCRSLRVKLRLERTFKALHSNIKSFLTLSLSCKFSINRSYRYL